MDDLVEQQLWNVKVAIEPTEAQKEGAQRSHSYLRELLGTGQFGSRIYSSFLSGSYARDTAIRPIDDVDIIFIIDLEGWPDSLYSLLNGKPAPSKVLETFSNAIRYRYPVSSVFHQRRSIRLSLYHLDIDVVPAISLDQSAKQLLIPDTERDEWIKSCPKIHAEIASALNQLRGNKLKPLIKLLKKWNSGIPGGGSLRSFCIETMALRIFGETDFNTLTDGMILFWDFASGFGEKAPLLNWSSKYGMSWTLLSGITVPDIGGSGSNIAAGTTWAQQRRFAEYAARSRDKLLAAKKNSSSTATVSLVRDALQL